MSEAALFDEKSRCSSSIRISCFVIFKIPHRRIGFGLKIFSVCHSSDSLLHHFCRAAGTKAFEIFSSCHPPRFLLRRFVIFVLWSGSKVLKKFTPCLSPTFSIYHVRDGQQERSLKKFFGLPSSEFFALLLCHLHVWEQEQGSEKIFLALLRLLRFVMFVPDNKGRSHENFSSCDPFGFFALLSLDSPLRYNASSSSRRIKSTKAAFGFTQSQHFLLAKPNWHFQ